MPAVPSIPNTVRATLALAAARPRPSPESVIALLRLDGHDPIIVRDTLRRLSKRLGRKGKRLNPLDDDLDVAIKRRVEFELRERMFGCPDLSREEQIRGIMYLFQPLAREMYKEVHVKFLNEQNERNGGAT